MNLIKRIASLAGLAAMLATGPAVAPGIAQEVFYAWAPKPSAPEGWRVPNRPVWRLSEILATHQKQKSSVHPVVILGSGGNPRNFSRRSGRFSARA